MKHLSFLVIVFLSISSFNSYAQDESNVPNEKTLYVIKKTDGHELYGYILEDNGREILVETKSIGKIYISKSNLVEMTPVKSEEIDQAKYGDANVSSPYTTRYYFTANAMTVKKHENYAMIHLYGPEVHFSLNNRFSLGIMTSWIASPFALAAKYSLYSENKFHLALGTIVGTSGYLMGGRAYGGLHWITATQGDRETNFSVSLGYGHLGFPEGFDLGQVYRFDKLQTASVDYRARQAIELEVLGNDYENPTLYANKNQCAAVLGFAGITPVGKSASFIFDSMVFLRKGQKVSYSDLSVTATYIDSTHQQGPDVTVTNTIEQGKVVWNENLSATILFMPSMRFQQSHTKAIQVSLGGFINIDSKGELTTSPFPMVSWLRQF